MGLDVLAASFINDNTGWTVGTGGQFAKTTDGGVTWVYNALPLFTGNGLTNFRPGLLGVQFLNANVGYAVGNNGAFVKTTDGGATWTYLSGPTGPMSSSGVPINNLRFFDVNNGWLIGNPINATTDYIFKTTDGGLTWTPATVPAGILNKSLNGIDFVGNTGYVCGQSGKIIKTVDGGTTWTDISMATANTTSIAGGTVSLALSQTYFSILALDANTVITASLNNGMLVRTTNGGTSWYASANQGFGAPQAAFRSMSRSGQDTIIVAAGQARMVKSIDRGLTWTTTQFYGTSSNIYNNFYSAIVSPTNPRKYIMLGVSGIESYSSDGGTTWANPYTSLGTYNGTGSSDAKNLFAVDFSSVSNGIVGGAHGALATTADGGQTWTDKSIAALSNTTGIGDYISAVKTPAANVAYIGTSFGYIQKSTDNGNTWNVQVDNTSTSGEGFTGMDFIGANTGWACSYFGNVYKTTDGTNWSTVVTVTSSQLNAIDFIDVNNGWLVANSGKIFHTTNGGATWATQTSGITNAILSVQFLDLNNGFACGAGGKVLKTIDGGVTWTQINTPITSGLNKVLFPDNMHGMVFGDNGVCFTTKDAGLTWIFFYAPTTDQLTNAIVPGGVANPASVLVIGGSLFGVKGDILNFDLSLCNLSFISQPQNATACAGTVTNFNVTTTGTVYGTYQWQVSTDGGVTFNDIAGATSSSYTFTALATQNGNQFRCKITSSCTSPVTSISGGAALTINPLPALTSQPTNTTTCAGNTANFSVTATGAVLTYQWQQSINGGTTFTNIAGATGATYSFATTLAQTTYQFRCVVSGICTPAVTSTAGVLTVNTPVAITAQPTPVTQCAGNSASFSATATGTSLTYQWQQSTDGGTTFTNIGGATNATYSFVTVSTQNNYQYRCVVTGSGGACNATTNATTLTVSTPVAISVQPANTVMCINNGGSLSITATGTSVLYQWQLSTNNGVSFTNINGATAATLPLTGVTAAMNGYVYRCIVTGTAPCSPVNSAGAILTVNPLPIVNISASPVNNLYPGLTTVINATGTIPANAAYSWFKNNILINSGTAVNSRPVDVNGIGDYYVVVTDINGCSATSNTLTIGDSVITKLFIYPNPSSGIFHVNYHSVAGSSTTRTLNIYDAKGARVLSKTYTITGAYQVMDVDLRSGGSGIYMVQLIDGNGKAIATGKVMIQ